MKTLATVLCVILGVILGIYVGGYLCFFGGIVSVITGIKAGWVATTIAWGVIRILVSGVVGWFIFFLMAIIGGAFQGID